MTKLPRDMLPQLYAGLMREVKVRLDAVNEHAEAGKIAAGSTSGFLHCEFCYLQLRRTIEVIGLAVLLAHNEIDDFRSKNFMKEWNAETLFKMLEKLSDDAFPEPAESKSIDETAGTADLLIGNKAKENRETLKKIYTDCSNQMHAGSLRNFLKSGGKRYNVQQIQNWRSFIIRLLNMHVILLPDRRNIMIVIMASLPDGDVHCRLEALGAVLPIGTPWKPQPKSEIS